MSYLYELDSKTSTEPGLKNVKLKEGVVVFGRSSPEFPTNKVFSRNHVKFRVEPDGSLSCKRLSLNPICVYHGSSENPLTLDKGEYLDLKVGGVIQLVGNDSYVYRVLRYTESAGGTAGSLSCDTAAPIGSNGANAARALGQLFKHSRVETEVLGHPSNADSDHKSPSQLVVDTAAMETGTSSNTEAEQSVKRQLKTNGDLIISEDVANGSAGKSSERFEQKENSHLPQARQIQPSPSLKRKRKRPTRAAAAGGKKGQRKEKFEVEVDDMQEEIEIINLEKSSSDDNENDSDYDENLNLAKRPKSTPISKRKRKNTEPAPPSNSQKKHKTSKRSPTKPNLLQPLELVKWAYLKATQRDGHPLDHKVCQTCSTETTYGVDKCRKCGWIFYEKTEGNVNEVLSSSLPNDLSAGDGVMVRTRKDKLYYPARIVELNKSKKCRVHFMGWGKQHDKTVLKSDLVAKIYLASFHSSGVDGPKVGDITLAIDGNREVFRAKVIDINPCVDATLYRVHYLGWPDYYDEWIGRERIVAKAFG